MVQMTHCVAAQRWQCWAASLGRARARRERPAGGRARAMRARLAARYRRGSCPRCPPMRVIRPCHRCYFCQHHLQHSSVGKAINSADWKFVHNIVL